jgi:hypothetical protein
LLKFEGRRLEAAKQVGDLKPKLRKPKILPEKPPKSQVTRKFFASEASFCQIAPKHMIR